jgi:alkylated DNA repair dioxygenase AlkB
MIQAQLFDLPPPLPAGLPDGLVYEADFLSREEEAMLITTVKALPLEAARYKAYTGRRRVLSFGGSFDYDANRLVPAAELVEALHPLRARVGRWIGVNPEAFIHTLVAEYPEGAPLGWHRDVPDFEDVVGVSLGSEALLRFRPYPPLRPKRSEIVRLTVAPRSIYLLRGPARWAWQHGVAPTKAQRWSITFRTSRRAT